MSEQNNMLAKKGKSDLATVIQSDAMKKQWALVLPKCLTADRLARVALTQLRKTPKLAQCTPESFLGAMMKCAETGLEPNGRDAHLVPYGSECTFIADYKGLVRLCRRDPSVKDVQVFTVRENDDFTWTPDGITHTFSLKKDRGDVVACYTKISWENGSVSYGEPMTRQEAEAVRDRSKAGRNGPWVTDFNEMWKKTVVRRDSKMWPLSPETMDAVSADMEADGIDISPAPYDDGKQHAHTEEIEEPVIPPVESKATKPAEKPAATESEEGAQKEEAPPSTALKSVDDMNKTECCFEMKQHEDKPYYANTIAPHIDPSFSPNDCPVSALRDAVADLRAASA